MNSEKVKEIKKALECCGDIKEKCDNKKCYLFDKLEYHYCERQLKTDILTLINELESENERLNKSDTSKEESSIEYYNLYKDLKRKNKDLNELCELQRVSIAESFVRENQLKDRIAELEKGNEALSFAVKQGFNDCQAKTLKQFAERLKEKAIRRQEFVGELAIDDIEYVKTKDIDETLKECLCDKYQ